MPYFLFLFLYNQVPWGNFSAWCKDWSIVSTDSVQLNSHLTFKSATLGLITTDMAINPLDVLKLSGLAPVVLLTHWGRYKMAAVSQTTLSNAFSWMRMLWFRLKFHWSLFLRFELTIFQHWFGLWLGAYQATSHYLNQWLLAYWRMYVSLGLNELTPLENNSTRISSSSGSL